jgi:hypothetical protein
VPIRCGRADVERSSSSRKESSLHLSNREVWALVHGLLIGGPFLLAFSGGLAALHGLRGEYLTQEGIRERVRQLRIGATAMAVLAWATVLTGTWVLLPWYREDSTESPQSVLLSDPDTRLWHEFADVWKTHIAHMAPILATSAAALVLYYGPSLARDRTARTVVLALLLGAFAVAGVAAVIGSLVTRAAPIR